LCAMLLFLAANFLECRLCELRRIPLLGTSVNRRKEGPRHSSLGPSQ
jgi:hypothetical protein